MNFKNYSKIIVANWKMNGSFSLINQYKNYLSYNFTEWSTMERIESEYPKNLKKRVEKIFN